MAAGSFRSGTLAAVAVVWVSLAAFPAFAVDPNQPFSGYIRTRFTTDDGLAGAWWTTSSKRPTAFCG